MIKKISKKAILIVFVVILGGLGGVLADRYAFPYLSTVSWFSKIDFLKKSIENVTVINRTEQVFVKEETSLSKITNQISSSVVNIISIPERTMPQNGTGLIVTSDGLIMTYATAIIAENAKYKTLTFDGNSYDASLVGVDAYSNLAFLKINASNLPAVAFGDSDNAQPGEKIVAIGNSLGSYNNIFSSGLLESFNPSFNLAGKTVSSSEKMEGVFETDLSSENNFIGGPVVDYSGAVIGIVGAIQKDNEKAYFAIPSNKAQNVINRAIKNELGQNPYLGIYYVPILKTFALANNLGADKGALIYSPSGQQGLSIIAGSPAQKAGLQIKDTILAIENQQIDEKNALSDLLYHFKKGDLIELTIMRNGQEQKVKVRL